MPEIRPFTGLLYDPAAAGPIEALTAPPYDVISPMDQQRYHRANPYNVVRLILGKVEPGDDASSNKYTRAASYLREWREQGVLAARPVPSLFPYEFEFHLGGRMRRVRGLIAEVALEPWGGSIIPHERTLPGPIEDRLRLLRIVRANLSPVYAVLAGDAASAPLARLLDESMQGPPDREVMDESGTRHRLWATPNDASELRAAMTRDRLMIADGHHRYTVALAFRDEMRASSGPGPWDSTMMLIVDARTEDPPVLPIHRVLQGGIPPPPSGELVRDMAEVLATLRDDDLTFGSVQMEDGELTHRIATLEGSPPTVCALHDQLLDRIAGLELRFVPDSVAAEGAVISGVGTAAYLLPPTRVDLVWDVIASGGKLPQKSTYFWPKPRTGLVIRPLDA